MLKGIPTWHTTEWFPCSTRCGPQTQTRTVTCRSSDGSHVDERHCNGNKRPAYSEPCPENPCSSKRFQIFVDT